MLEWIITSCVLIGIVLLVRLCLKNKISLRLRYALWLIVLVRLLVPVNFFNSSMSVMNVVPESETVAELQQPEILDAPEQTSTQPITDTPVTQVPILPVNPTPITPVTPEVEEPAQLPQVQTPTQEAPPEKSFSVVLLLQIIWIAGIAITGGVFLFANIRFALRLKRTRRIEDVACPLRVYRTAVIDTPCLFGVFRPAIYLTEQAGEDEGQHHILTHEMTHYKHLDHIWGLLRCLCLALHWYNPFVWVAAICSRRDSELACDEAVIKRLGEENRAAYGRTLVRMTCEKQSPGSIFTTATTMTGSKKTIKNRIKLIAKHPKTALYAVICLVIVAAIAVGCTFTGAKPEDDTNLTSDAESVETVSTQPKESTQQETTESTVEKYPEVVECDDIEGFVTQESLDSGKPNHVFAKKYRNSEDPYLYDLYIEVDTETDKLQIKLETNVSEIPHVVLLLGDVDGDKVEEILVRSDTGGVGGFGIFQTWVLKVKDGEIYNLFVNFGRLATGFECRFLEDYKLEITNRFVGYKLVFDVKDEYKNAYKSAKEPPVGDLLFDPFYYFEPEDVDHDGISEIICGQYTSYLTHADYTGTAHSVLKFNTQTQKFEVIDAWYEPNLPEKELSEEEVLELLRQQMDVPHSYVIEEAYIDYLYYEFEQSVTQEKAQDGSWYYKVERSYDFPLQSYSDKSIVEFYYVYEGEKLVCYLKDENGKISSYVIDGAFLEQIKEDGKNIDSGYALYPQYLTDFQSKGTDEETGLVCYTFNLPVDKILKETSLTAELIELSMESYKTKYKDICDLNVQCTVLVDPETMCTMSYKLEFEELKPYVLSDGAISAEYALPFLELFYIKYTFDYNLTETTVLPKKFK